MALVKEPQEHSGVLDPAVQAVYQKRRRLRRLAMLGFVTMWIIAMLGGFSLGRAIPEWVPPIWMLCMFGWVLLGVFSWRCPRCGYFIAGHFSAVRYCWKCGVRLS
jgi:hypothetical protein